MREETDFLGTLEVPADRYYGIETQRAILNFPITGTPISAMPELLTALAWIKEAAASVNERAGELAPEKAEAIRLACQEIAAGLHADQFPVDVLQGGAGTSTNMNMNEVVANLALEKLGHARARYDVIHPKDHVNRCQSTNDAYATAVRICIVLVNRNLTAAVRRCVEAFETRAESYGDVPKLGRTQLQDAVPMTVGAELCAFATALEEDIVRFQELEPLLLETNLGGTAIGTGIGASAYYAEHIVDELARLSSLPVTASRNRVEASWDTGVFVMATGVLKRLAAKLSKIANDLRLLSSGPMGGLGELRLPQVQPGSSIMPGKVNPVIPEVVNQACYRAFGADTVVTFAAEAGQLQLNAMEPVMLWSIYEATTGLTAAVGTLIDRCILELDVDAARCRELLDASPARVTSLAPIIGYAAAAEVAIRMVEHRETFTDALRAVADADTAVRTKLRANGNSFD